MDYLDGMILIGGTVYNKYVKKDKPKDDNEYQKIELNPAGDGPFIESIRKIKEKAKQLNDNNHKFILLGECVSFEKMIMSEGDDRPIMHVLHNNSIAQPIYFNYGFDYNKNSKMNNFFTKEDKENFENGDNAYFFHNFGFSLEEFMSKKHLADNYYPVATYKRDPKKSPKQFVAIIEHKKYPFFALQFHPEKILFETKMHIDQTPMNVKMSKRFMDFIYHELEDGALGAEIPEHKLREFNC